MEYEYIFRKELRKKNETSSSDRSGQTWQLSWHERFTMRIQSLGRFHALKKNSLLTAFLRPWVNVKFLRLDDHGLF